jgi:hypothetical protein
MILSDDAWSPIVGSWSFVRCTISSFAEDSKNRGAVA